MKADAPVLEPVELRDLAVLKVPVGRVRPNPWNPNRQSDAVYRAERESIRRFGFIDPITVMVDPDEAEFFLIIDGEHRWRAAQDEGYTEVLIAVLPEVTVDEAKKLTVILNETRGDADVVLLGQLLTDLRASAPTPEDFTLALPYTQAELDHLLSIGSADWDDFTGPPGGGSSRNANDHQVVLDFDDASMLERFNEWLDVLRGEWGLEDEGPTAVVVEAVRRAAES